MIKTIQAALKPMGKRYIQLNMAGMILLALLSAGANVYYADMLGQLAGALEGGANPWSVVYRIIGALSGVCLVCVAETAYKAKIKCDMAETYQKRFSGALLRAQTGDLRKMNPGDTYVRGTTNLSGAADIWPGDLWKLVFGGCKIAFSVFAILFVKPVFCFLMIVVTAAAFFLQIIVVKPMQSCKRRIFHAVGQAEALSADIIDNIETVQIEKAQKWAFARYQNALSGVERQYQKELLPIGLTMAGSFLCSMLPMLFGIFYPALSYLAGGIALADCVTVITLALSVSTVFSAMPQILASLEQNAASLQRVEEVWKLRDEREVYKTGGSYSFQEKDMGGDVLCKAQNLSFGYTGEEKIIRNCSFELRKNSLNLLTGMNGAGKSTLSKLLNGLYLPESGAVEYFTGTAEGLEELRSHVVIAEQEPVLFEGSLFDNIKQGNSELTDEFLRSWYASSEIREAFSGIAGGGEAPVEQNGSNLSGGQKKCISVCRALLSGADMIILDEPTANLSRDISRLIVGEIKRTIKAGQGKTLLVITHDEEFEKAFPDANKISIADKRAECEGV